VERAASKYNLTKREHQILDLIRQGHSNIEMGNMLAISQWTVKNHVQSIDRKMDVKNRTALTCKILQGNHTHQWISPLIPLPWRTFI